MFTIPHLGFLEQYKSYLQLSTAYFITVVTLVFTANFGARIKAALAAFMRIFYVPIFGEYLPVKKQRKVGVKNLKKVNGNKK